MTRPFRLGRTCGFLALFLALAAPRADAQYFMGGGGGFGGFGGFGGMGMTLYDQEMLKGQTYLLNANRYNMMSSGINLMNQRAMLTQQEAISVAMQNERTANQMMQERYNLYNQKAKAYEDAVREIAGVPIENLLDTRGHVLWPDFAPAGVGGVHEARRNAADDAIARAFAQYQEKGQADVPLVVEAKRQLRAYGEPALKLLGSRNNPRPRAEMVQFLNTLDLAIDGLAEKKAG